MSITLHKGNDDDEGGLRISRARNLLVEKHYMGAALRPPAGRLPRRSWRVSS